MSTSTRPLSPGDRVGDYQVERMISLSARSAVYTATDVNLDQRFVLKECLPAHLVERRQDGIVEARPGRQDAWSEALARFRRACKVQAGIRHPNLPRVVQYLEDRGTAFCVMEWQDGETLAQWVGARGAMPWDDVRTLLHSLSSALQCLHDEGRWHGELAPEHVFLTPEGRPLLLGVAHEAGSPPAEDSPWVAPECLDSPPAPGPAADVYSLCALACYCLTGQTPTPARHRELQPDALAPVASIAGAAANPGLAQAIDFGLRLDPARRPQSIAQWRQALESIEWRKNVAGSAVKTPERERPEWLSPLLLGAFLAILLASVAYLAFKPEPASFDTVERSATPQPAAPVVDPEETRQWQVALRADTIEAYRGFLERYPGSTYAGQAQIQLDILDQRQWEVLAAENTLPAYQRYLDLFPAGLHQADALVAIDRIEQTLSAEERARLERERQDERDWLAARSNGTVEAFDRYLADWPSGLHAGEARTLRQQTRSRALEARAWAAAEQLNTSEAYRGYLDAYPAGEHSAEALISLEHLNLGQGKVFRDCDVCPAMMVLAAGEFRQGALDGDSLAGANERPTRQVRIDAPFAMGIHEVTFAQWDACVADSGCRHQPTDNGWGRDNRPVIMVSWDDAQEYVAWLSALTRQAYRLPSESEWEYAARAGEPGPWPGGSQGQVCGFANIAGGETEFRWRLQECADARALGTLPVGSLAANAFGLHDVIGNVAEWTADCLNISYVDAPTDGSAWTRGICSSHMTRGGSWVTGSRESRLPARFSLDSGDRNDFTGFRVVRTMRE